MSRGEFRRETVQASDVAIICKGNFVSSRGGDGGRECRPLKVASAQAQDELQAKEAGQ